MTNKKYFVFLAVVAICTALIVQQKNVNAVAANKMPDETKDAVVLYVGSKKLFVNNEQKPVDKNNTDATIKIINNRAYAPVNILSEVFGEKFSFDGKNSVKLNGTAIKLDADVINIKGITYAPLKSVAQALGKHVFYDNKLIVISGVKDIFNPDSDKEKLLSIVKNFSSLPTIGTREKLIELVGKPEPVVFAVDEGKASFQFGEAVPTSAPASGITSNTTAVAQESADYSKTNVQVQGVDEGDILKTDGEYIYFSGDGVISVVKAQPADNMKLEYTIQFNDNNYFYANEIYVDGDSLIVIGNSYKEKPITTAYVYDISNKSNVNRVREVSIQGNYVSSRKIGSALYIVTNSYLFDMVNNNDYVQPVYKDSAVGSSFKSIPYSEICYFPEITAKTYTIVAGFELDKPNKEVAVNTFLGGSENIYASAENLYITTVNYNQPVPLAKRETTSSFGTVSNSVTFAKTFTTKIYKFAFASGDAIFVGDGEVDGTVLNQFSMDENAGFLRVATTSFDTKGNQVNNLVVLDKKLEQVGKISDIAPGERIYSARFMGDRGYMVTFKQVDPLFAIDLKDPYNPKILGALKIPGYSNYLHPYDENHLIGIGKDTTVLKDNAYYLGMKLSMFDVTDVTNPKELFTEIIGDRGTDSPALYNHKAFLFSKEKGLLAFPINVMKVNKNQKGDELAYGEFDFQGAYVYNVDTTNGFRLKGTVTHQTDEDYLKFGMYGGDYRKTVERLLYIGDDLYSVSQQMIKANSLSNGLKEKGSVNLK